MSNKKLLIVDLETSGLSPEGGHVILSIGAIVQNSGTFARNEPFSEFYALIRPTEAQWRRAAPEALKLNGLTWDCLVQEGKPFSEVRDDFLRFLVERKVSQRSYVFLGQNPEFDLRFLCYYMGQELEFINAPISDPLDIRHLYGILANRRVVPVLRRLDGHSISRALGVQEEPYPHNALEGARVVKRNYDRMVELGLYE